MRKILVILAVVLWLTFPMSAEAASPWPNPPGQDKEKGDTIINNGGKGGTGIGVGIGIAGAEATAVNMNYISTRQDLSVKNSASQLQGQGQKQSIDAPMTNTTDISIVNPENKRELPGFYGYQAPGQIEYRGPYEKGIQAKATPWRMKKEWTKEEAAGFYSVSDSASCKVYPVQKKAATENLTVDTPKEHGAAACILECKADSGFELWGTVAKEAMDCGGSLVDELSYRVTFANKSFGWNIGLGGGVTAVDGANDTKGGSVGGGTGIGSVTTEPIEKVQAIFIVY